MKEGTPNFADFVTFSYIHAESDSDSANRALRRENLWGTMSVSRNSRRVAQVLARYTKLYLTVYTRRENISSKLT